MKQLILLLLVVASISYATTKGYDVVPCKNFIAVETLGTRGVFQYIRNTLDSLTAVSVWIGDTFAGQLYFLEVRDSATGTPVAYSPGPFHAPKCWAWLDVPLAKEAQPVRGRTFKIIVTRLFGGAISFAYDPRNPYIYGKAVVPGSTPPMADSELAA